MKQYNLVVVGALTGMRRRFATVGSVEDEAFCGVSLTAILARASRGVTRTMQCPLPRLTTTATDVCLTPSPIVRQIQAQRPLRIEKNEEITRGPHRVKLLESHIAHFSIFQARSIFLWSISVHRDDFCGFYRIELSATSST